MLLIILIACYAHHFLSLQTDFISQKSEIEELISKWNNQEYQVLFYSKFHYELNYIKYFWAHTKGYTRDHCDYILEELHKRV